MVPKTVRKTLASVPAPFSSPVITMSSYVTGTSLRALLAKLSMNFVHSKVWKSSRLDERGIIVLQKKMYLNYRDSKRWGRDEDKKLLKRE